MSRGPDDRFSEEPGASPRPLPRRGWEDAAGDEPVPDIARPSDESSLGSLAQAARLKQLNVARWTLIIVGILYAAFHTYEFVAARQLLEAEVRKHGGVVVNQAEFDKVLNLVRLIIAGAIAVGVIFIILGLLVHTFPLAMTISGLVLFLVYHLALVIVHEDKTVILRGAILKIVVIVALVKAIQAAASLQHEEKTWKPEYE